MPPLPEHLPVVIEEWSPDGSRLLEILGRAINGSIALGAYPAARGLRPRGRIIIRQGARVLVDSADLDRAQPAAGEASDAERI